MKCRIETALNICKCKPYFYPSFGKYSVNYSFLKEINLKYFFLDGPECTVEGLICLEKKSWPTKSVNQHHCRCMKSCTEVNYMENNFEKRVWYDQNTQNLF